MTLLEHLPILPVIIPLIAAPLCAILHRRVLVWPIFILVTWTVFAATIGLFQQISIGDPLIYKMGGWLAPIGIEYRIDLANSFLMILISGMAAFVSLYGLKSSTIEIAPHQHHFFCSAFLLCLTGLMGITITGDAFNVYVFLEISSLATYALVSIGRDKRALRAAYTYLIMGTIGATFILISIGLLYAMTGTLNMADLSNRLTDVRDTRTIHTAFAFLTAGLALKIALFPMHTWLPNVYAYAPSIVTVFLAATSTKVSLYVFIRFVFTIFGGDYGIGTVQVNDILVPLALIGIFTTSVVAIFQNDLKLILAYSSVAQIGYIVLGFSMGTISGLTASLTHIFNHGIIKGALFMAVGSIVFRLGTSNLDDMAGIGRRMPITSFAFVLGGLGLIGVPITAGFISKWYLLISALEQNWWTVTVLILISSLLAVAYIWRFVEVAYFRQVPEGCDKVKEAPASMQLALWLLLAGMIYFGIQTDFTVAIAQQAALSLLGGM